MGTIREILGTGALFAETSFEIKILLMYQWQSSFYSGWIFVLGVIIAMVNKLTNKNRQRKSDVRLVLIQQSVVQRGSE